MPYTATIRDTRTGEVVQRVFEDLAWDDGSDSLWSDGNFACDCNRWIEFQRAKGLNPDLDDDSVPCDNGIERRFVVDQITLPNGTIVYQEPRGIRLDMN